MSEESRWLPSPAVGVWLTTAIWLAVAGGLWGVHDHQLRNGEEIQLKTIPVDPRDLLRGDYVTLDYEISTAEAGDDTPWYFQPGQVVFVALDKRGEEWAIAGIDRRPPEAGRFLRGTIRSASQTRLRIAYGIERFFVPEGEGQRYEEARNRDRLWAVASVSPHGVARLKRLEIR